MKKALPVVVAIVLLLIISAAVLASGTTISSNDSGEYTWFLGTDSSEDTVTQLFAVKFAELVNEYSGGKMNIIVQPNGTLGSDNALCESVKAQDGVNFVVQTTAPQVNFMPQLSVFDAACVYGDINDFRKAVDDEEFMATIEKIYDDGNFKLLGYADQNFRVLTCNKEVKSVSDMAGMKIRTMGNNLHIQFFNATGAGATPMAFGDVYVSLQNKTLDGEENPYEVVVSSKFYEVQKYVVATNHLPHILSLVTGKDLYDMLSDEERAVLDRAADEAKVYAREQTDARVEDRLQIIQENGATVVEFNQDLFNELQQIAQTKQWDAVKEKCGEELFEAYSKYATQ